MFELVFPQTMGEWLAWGSALFCVMLGLIALLMPKFFMGMVGLADAASSPAGVSQIRSVFAGLLIGVGLAAILFAQPLIYLALGFAFAIMVLGRLISIVFDRAYGIDVLGLIVFEAALAIVLIGYATGKIA